MIFDLQFRFSPKVSSDLLWGLLVLRQDGQDINTWIATSSLPGRQWWGSWDIKGGLIPPRRDGYYQVKTNALYMPNLKGVEGSFYEIAPFSVPTPGAARGDFGVHFDANQPGSLGCIVLKNQGGWDAYRRDMLKVSKTCKQIELSIDYNK